MKAISNCLGCFGNQISKMMISEKEKRKLFLQLFNFTLKYKNLFEDSPVELARIIYKNKIVVEFFKKQKDKEIKWSLRKYKALKQHNEIKNLNLIQFLKLATSANVFDFAAPDQLNWKKEIKKIKSKIKVDDIRGRILYITDNAAEIGFDLLFLEKLKQNTKVEIDLMVRQNDFINDLSIADLKEYKINKLLKPLVNEVYGLDIYENAKGKSAIKLSELDKFIKNYDTIISKGQANYEILSEFEPNPKIIFALVAKCEVVARAIGIKEGTGIIMKYETKSRCKDV